MKKYHRLTFLIVDDYDSIISGIKLALHKAGKGNIVHTASSVKEANCLIDFTDVDIAIINLNFRKANNTGGIDLCKSIKHKLPNTKIICFTGFHSVQNIKKLVEIGVDSIVAKYDGLHDLIKAIDIVLKQEKYYSQEILNVFPKLFLNETITPNKHPKFTKRQIEVIELIAQAKSNQEIAEVLSISKKTVEGHITNISYKLDIKKSDRVKILYHLGRLI